MQKAKPSKIKHKRKITHIEHTYAFQTDKIIKKKRKTSRRMQTMMAQQFVQVQVILFHSFDNLILDMTTVAYVCEVVSSLGFQ